MAQRMHIPEFGDWQGAENAPYSAYFENARKKGTGRGTTNPNGSQHKPSFPMEAKSGSHKVDASLGRRYHNESKVVPPNGSETSQKGSDRDSPVNRHGGRDRTMGVKPRRVEESGTRDRFGRPRVAGKVTESQGKGGGVSSPSRERKSLSDASSQGDAKTRKSRLRSVAQNDERSDGPVPKFGKWDENNPSSAEMYSEIFEKVREERLGGGGKVPPPPEAETSDDNIQRQDNIVNYKELIRPDSRTDSAQFQNRAHPNGPRFTCNTSHQIYHIRHVCEGVSTSSV